MADIRDYLEAAAETDRHVANLDAYGGRVEDSGGGDVALAALLAGRAIVAAIREASTRADYIARELGR